MTKTIKVELIDPIETHSGMVTVAEFKAPNARDAFTLGEPYKIARTNDGTIFTVDNDDVILAYMEKCVMAPLDPVSMMATTYANAVAMREAFLGFFAEERVRMSKPPATSSSST